MFNDLLYVKILKYQGIVWRERWLESIWNTYFSAWKLDQRVYGYFPCKQHYLDFVQTYRQTVVSATALSWIQRLSSEFVNNHAVLPINDNQEVIRMFYRQTPCLVIRLAGSPLGGTIVGFTEDIYQSSCKFFNLQPCCRNNILSLL